MYKVVLLLFLLIFITGCSDEPETIAEPTPTPSPTPTVDVVDALNIDNEIVYFDLLKDTPCYPFLLDDGNAYYCDINQTIYYGNKLTTDNSAAIKYFILAHEDGHSEDPFHYYFENVFMQEQFADCFGGMRMAELFDQSYIDMTELQQITDFIHSLSPSDHGTAIQRYNAFAYGYLHGDCEFDIL